MTETCGNCKHLRSLHQQDGFCGVCKCQIFIEISPPKRDMVNHPPHYTSHPSGVECITITEHMSFNVGNAVKYLWRADAKGAPIQDLEKAAWYINREIQKRKRDAREEPED